MDEHDINGRKKSPPPVKNAMNNNTMRHAFSFYSLPMSRLFRRRHCLLAAGFFFVLMVAIGSIPGEAEAFSAVVHDKLLHFAAYAFLGSLIYGGQEKASQMRRALTTLLVVALLGGLDETIQIFLPYRRAGMDDWFFDMLAVMASVTVLTLLHSLNAVVRRHRAGGGGNTKQTAQSPVHY